MGEFFKGWRRKTGLVILAMAIALTVGWLRSLADQENVTVYRRQSVSYIIHSREGRLYWMRDELSYGRFDIWSTPYWSIVLPLTLLSACLILWKPQKTNQNATAPIQSRQE